MHNRATTTASVVKTMLAQVHNFCAYERISPIVANHPARNRTQPPMSEPVIRVEDLHKSYDAVEALRGVSFEVNAGEVFGLLGPNGAGKTSTIEILEGLRSAGSRKGNRRRTRSANRRPRIQARSGRGAAIHRACRTNCALAKRFRSSPTFIAAHHDTEALLKRFQLEEKRNAFYSQLSGGQKQRLALAPRAGE